MTYPVGNVTPAVVDCATKPTEWVLLPRVATEAVIRSMRGRALIADCSTEQGARDIYSNIIYTASKANIVVSDGS